jgi:GalNAc-alpha-(1->4)-GalNAc-alpha-(1->3)-diNAcBac-PP-undecaprenol alpha-1,4-N-acetyl-D-galactosaminyltransferase
MIIGPSLKMGGMERASANLASHCSHAGHTVLYHALFRQNRFFSLAEGVQFDEPPAGRNTARLDLNWTLLRIRRAVREFRPDTVLVFNKFYSAVTILALVGVRVPVFVSDRASPLYPWPRHVAAFNRLVFFLLRPAGAIAQTRVAAEHQGRYFGPRVPIRVIPNAILPAEFHEVERRRQVLAVGRLTDPLKGFDRLVAAFARVGETDWKLVFAGGDEEGAELKAQAAELGIAARVEFLGRVRDLGRLYAESGIFVIPSRSEGFPNALGEAMAAGLPCVSFDFVAGPRDLIEDGVNGHLVPDGDLDGMAERIRRLTRDEGERAWLGRNARASARRLDAARVAEQVVEFILGGPGAGGRTGTDESRGAASMSAQVSRPND